MTYADQIHEAIHSAFYDHVWSGVVMTNRPGAETGFVRTTQPPDAAVKPAGILIDEATSAFSTDERHGRAVKVDRVDWIWDVVISFQDHVSWESLEIQLEDPIIITRAVSGLPRQITITVLDATYSHPTRHQSTSGSKAQFRFAATLSNL